MHVLLTNDDGPPNDLVSGYIRYLVDAIETQTDWDLSIVVPDVQRSWIGKAHFAGKELSASFIYPNKDSNSYNGPFPVRNKKYVDMGLKEWALIDGTPASCTDIGVHHLYKEKGPVDLVISGPNVGKNTTAAYILSSGTIGAALEGAIHGKKAIGVSFGYTNKESEPRILRKAAEYSVKIIEYLYKNWGCTNSATNTPVDLYSVNIPLVESLLTPKQTEVYFTSIFQNRWVSIFKSDNSEEQQSDIADESAYNRVQFKWNPDFEYVHRAIRESEGINDGKVIFEGNISVTPLRASFFDVVGTTNNKISIEL